MFKIDTAVLTVLHVSITRSLTCSCIHSSLGQNVNPDYCLVGGPIFAVSVAAYHIL